MGQRSDPSCTQKFVRKAQKGDQEAFAALVRRYNDALETLIRLRLGPALRRRIEAEDILQETYLRAFETLHTFEWRGAGSFYRWLGGIAEHAVQRQVRYHLGAKKRAVTREQSLDHGLGSASGDGERLARLLGVAGTSPSQALRREERFERLEAALNSLSPEYRDVIILARIREMPVKEIAQTTGRTPEAVSMLLLRALRQLKAFFGNTESLNLPMRSLEESGAWFPEPGRRGNNGSSHHGNGYHDSNG